MILQSVNINKENTRELAAEAARWTEALVKALAAAPPAHLPILQGHIEEMTKCVQRSLLSIMLKQNTRALKEIARSNKQRAKQTALNAVLHKSRDAEETQRMRTKLNSTYERFMVRHLLIHLTFVPRHESSIGRRADSPRYSAGVYHRSTRSYPSSHPLAHCRRSHSP
jgi:hypothetical protein